MKAMMKGLLTIALVASAACDGAPTAASASVSPTGGPEFAKPGRSSLSFSYTQNNSTETPQTSSGGVGRIDFTGSLTTGTPCYELSAAHSAQSNQITVTVTATGTGGFCAQVITYNNYQGAVTGLAAGTYTFTVLHSVGGSVTTAQTSTVVVQ